MRELARAVGRSPASFYNYFDSKEQLLFEMQCRAFASLLASSRHALEGEQDPRERLYLFVLNHVRAFAAHPDLMRVLVHEASALPAPRRAVVREYKQAYFEIAQRLVAAVAELPPQEIERSTYCLFGMLNWMYGWYEPTRHGAPEELSRTIFRIALGGLGAEAPNKSELKRLDKRLDRLGIPPLLEGERGGVT